jgi:excisionase family DNA binding protein
MTTAVTKERASTAQVQPIAGDAPESGFAKVSEVEFRNVAWIAEEAFRQAETVTTEATKATGDFTERNSLLADAIRCGELGLHYLRVLAGGLTTDELGERLHMSPRTLKDLAGLGRIPHHRIGKHYRFSADDIAEILQLTKVTSRPARLGLLERIAA